MTENKPVGSERCAVIWAKKGVIVPCTNTTGDLAYLCEYCRIGKIHKLGMNGREIKE